MNVVSKEIIANSSDMNGSIAVLTILLSSIAFSFLRLGSRLVNTVDSTGRDLWNRQCFAMFCQWSNYMTKYRVIMETKSPQQI